MNHETESVYITVIAVIAVICLMIFSTQLIGQKKKSHGSIVLQLIEKFTIQRRAQILLQRSCLRSGWSCIHFIALGFKMLSVVDWGWDT